MVRGKQRSPGTFAEARFASHKEGLFYFPKSWLSLARVAGPRIPVPAVNPEGARISEAYFSWNFTTAALVKEPKSVVSLPGEPTPEEAIFVPESWLRSACRHFTSLPVLPTFKALENTMPRQCGGTSLDPGCSVAISIANWALK